MVEMRRMQAAAKNIQISTSAENNCAIVEGFADRSESKSKQTSLQKFIKNLQPISVGV